MRDSLNPAFRSQGGVALPVALFALVVIGALVTGMFFTARTEIRSGENTMSGARALEAAQAGLQMGWPQVITAAGALSDGQTVALARTQLGATGSYYQDSVTRLNRYMYLLRSYGTYEPGGEVTSSRVVAMLVKRYMPELNVNSGFLINGTVIIRGSVRIDGHDVAPAGWSTCQPTSRFEPGVRSAGPWTFPVTGGAQVIGPVPPGYTSQDTTMQNMARIMDTLFFQLAGQATKTLSSTSIVTGPTTVSGLCKTGDLTNWGDPGRNSPVGSCEAYFPIVYLNNGDPSQTYVVKGDGQGVLLVNGNLKFNGGGHFAGLILTRGIISAGSGTSIVDGSVISLGVNTSTISGNLTLTFSSCAVDAALRNLSAVAPATARAGLQF